jgi:hypothetical protein
MKPTLKGLDQWPNVSALPSSSPVEAVSSPERVETAVLSPEWITADFEWPSGNPTPWTVFIDHFRLGDGTFKAFNLDDMKAAFRAGYEVAKARSLHLCNKQFEPRDGEHDDPDNGHANRGVSHCIEAIRTNTEIPDADGVA